jgi:RNA polymerase sigma-70 factor (ECF subfamily)
VIQRISDREIHEAVSQLRPMDQEVLRLAAWEGLKPAQIASVLDIEPHAASVRLGRARTRLARKLAGAGLGTAALARAPVGKDLEW